MGLLRILNATIIISTKELTILMQISGKMQNDNFIMTTLQRVTLCKYEELLIEPYLFTTKSYPPVNDSICEAC